MGFEPPYREPVNNRQVYPNQLTNLSLIYYKGTTKKRGTNEKWSRNLNASSVGNISPFYFN